MRMMAEKARVIAEGAGALPLAAVLSGKAKVVRLSASFRRTSTLKKFSGFAL